MPLQPIKPQSKLSAGFITGAVTFVTGTFCVWARRDATYRWQSNDAPDLRRSLVAWKSYLLMTEEMQPLLNELREREIYGEDVTDVTYAGLEKRNIEYRLYKSLVKRRSIVTQFVTY